MRLFDHLALPSAPSLAELWRGPLQRISALAAAAALLFALLCSAESWPVGSRQVALTYALVTAYAVLRWRATATAAWARAVAVRFAAHVACATFALLCVESAHLAGWNAGGDGLLLLGAGFLAIGELLALLAGDAGDARDAGDAEGASAWRVRAAVATCAEWAGSLLALFLALTLPEVGSTFPAVLPGRAALAATLLAAAVLRYGQRRPGLPGRWFASSLTAMFAAGLALAWLLSRAGLVDPSGVTIAALAALAVGGGAAHLLAPAHLSRPAPVLERYATRWALLGCALALGSATSSVPPAAPLWLPTALSIGALAGAAAWFGWATHRSGRPLLGQLAWLALLLGYLRLRLAPLPLTEGFTATTDAVVLVALAFALHLAAELLHRASWTALERAARSGAAVIPLVAALVGVMSWFEHDGSITTLRLALLVESLGVLYTLAMRNGGPRAFGLLAIFLYNLGLALLWMHSGRRDPLYYTLPAGASVFVIARIYRQNLEGGARRGLHFAGALLVYFSTYYRVVQFDSGLYPLLLGGLTLGGLAAGFFLQLRDLFLISAGFIVLNVVSNLTYYGVHRPLLGWTLLTLAGLGLTACGVMFQLRRAQLRELFARVRSGLRSWE